MQAVSILKAFQNEPLIKERERDFSRNLLTVYKIDTGYSGFYINYNVDGEVAKKLKRKKKISRRKRK